MKDKPVWLRFYYGLAIILILFSIIATLTDRTGFAILATGPLFGIALVILGLAHLTNYCITNNKKALGNWIIGPFFILVLGFIIYVIIQRFIWFSTLGYGNLGVIFGIVIFNLLLLFLLVKLNKKY